VTYLRRRSSQLVDLYAHHEAIGLFLFLIVEEAGVPLWFLPGDTLVMQAGSRPDRTPASVLQILVAATSGATLGSSVLYFVVRIARVESIGSSIWGKRANDGSAGAQAFVRQQP
jgi:membrane protein DedA with SNARE-associated domain